MAATSRPGSQLAVVGAGAWGTTLALLLSRKGHRVNLWARREALATALNEQRENRERLPGVHLPDSVRATSDLSLAVAGAEAMVLAVPSRGLRETLAQLPSVPAVVSASKGIEPGSFRRFTEIVAEYRPEAQLAALSGPNLATEIAGGKPAAATVASSERVLAQAVQRWFQQPSFRIYTSSDLVGVEVAGAMKNVIALAAGMVDGLDLGDNAKATIITRGLNEIVLLGTHLGGAERTFYGLAGLGDMVATCASARSRNHTAGERFALGATLDEIEASGITAEGIPTTRAVHGYAQAHGLELPISSEVYRVVFEGKTPREALRDLIRREVKAE